ncbi:unnamed protein product [Prorocentrum cordatum]|uniref:Pinin/SDK/MemA protein domain-containing protein n=1 Tax=Prorocentrum cordatum TaxID=2364126 RepID=A0ABN9TVU6_9DINO|nr:unnamed protein product [Polarella glacialis]
MRSGAASEGARHRREQFEAAVKRIDEQLAQARANEAALAERGREYDELGALLEELPEKLEHPIMVPFGPLAFFPGHIQHTSEVLTQLSSEWFVLRPAKHARGLVDRRQARLRSDQADVAKELELLRARRRVAAGAAGLPAEAEPKAESHAEEREGGGSVRIDEDGYFEIREPADGEAEADQRPEGATVSTDADGYLEIREPLGEAEQEEAAPRQRPAEAAPGAPRPSELTLAPEIARLRELERLEEEEAGGARASAPAPAPPPAAAATQQGRPDAMEELRRLERLEELEALDALDELLERSEQDAGGACQPPGLEVAAEQPTRALAARSPADIFEAMRRAEEAAAGAAAAPPPPRAAEVRFPPAAGEDLPRRGTELAAGPLPARVVEARPSLLAASEADDSGGPGGLGSPLVGGAAVGSAAAPARVSKFKADRQRARG